MGELTEQCNADGRQPDPRGAGRVRRPLAPARRRGLEERPVRRRGRAGRDPAAQGRPDRGLRRTRASAATPPPSRSAKLRPAFAKDGTITAGSASQISDGACAVVVMSKAKAEELGLTWLAEIGAHGQVAGPDSTLQMQPANAIAKALRQGGHRRRRPRPGRDQRGVRRGRHRVGPRARHRRGQGQRQRRRHRARPPGRHVRRPDRAAPRPRAQAPRRRHRRGRAVRRRRPGRRADRARARLRLAESGGPAGADGVDVAGPRSSAARASGESRVRVARLISLVEDDSPLLREVMAGLAPYAGNAQVVGITGSPGVGKSTSTNALVTALRADGQAGRRARGRPVLAVLRRRAARRPGADAGPRPRQGRLHPLDGLARPPRRAVRGRRRRRCGCSTPPAATWSWSRPSASARARSRSPRWPTPRWCCSRPGMGDGIQAAKAGILEIGDVYVVNKADRDGADQVAPRPALHAGAGRAAPRARGGRRSCKTVASTGRGHRRGGRGDRRSTASWLESQRRARAAPAAPGARRDRGDRGHRAARAVGRRARARRARRARGRGGRRATPTRTPPPTCCWRASRRPDAT